MIRFEIFAAVIAAAAAAGCPSEPDPQPPAPAVYLEQEYEEAYMNMEPSSADDFSSPVRCLYTGRLLPLGKTVQLSESAEAAVVTGTADASVADAENRWRATDSFSVDKTGPCTVFVRRPGEEAVSRYRFIAVESFGSVSQLTVHAETAAAVGWASEVIEYVKGKDLTSFMDPQLALGSWLAHKSEAVSDPVYDVVSLGNGGSLTLKWETPAGNGIGPDFAVFENGMSAGENSVFAELAFVEVSSDGSHFERFSSVSKRTETVSSGGQIEADSVFGLAGAKPLGYGTLFDLDELADREAVKDGRLDLNAVRYLRLIDIPGCAEGTDGYEAQFDSFGNVIYDAFKTVGSAGFDAACAAVLNGGE